MSINYQRSHEFNIQKISKTTKDISDNVSKISNEDLIEYLELQNQKQQKHDNLNLILNIIIIIVGIATPVATIVK